MASDREKDRTELRKEIKIAIFWRKLIGDNEYIKFNPDDILRWHLAFVLRGEDEMRTLIDERYPIGARRTRVLGVVGEAPHPPAWIVREWLETQHPKFPKWRIFSMSCGFLVIAGMLFPVMHGCQSMQTMSPQVYVPPTNIPSTQMPVGAVFNVQVPSPTNPITVQPISTRPQPQSGVLGFGQSPPVSQPQMGVPITAVTPPATGTTGPANVGASGPAPAGNTAQGGATSSSGGTQPP